MNNQTITSIILILSIIYPVQLLADQKKEESHGSLKKASIEGYGHGWRELKREDFVNVNCDPKTWRWEKGHAFCTGQPVGVIRLKESIKNFELVCEWMHKEQGGNSGVFVWASPASIKNLENGKGRLPHGIEVQVLDLGYAEKYTKKYNKPANWFTSHGDVFPTGPAKMKPFLLLHPMVKEAFLQKILQKVLTSGIIITYVQLMVK